MEPRRGFTLIEVIISTAVILMVLAVSLPAFLEFQRRQNLRTGSQLIRDAILETQNYALAPRNEKTAGADLYRIIFIKGEPSSYEIDEQTNTDPATPSWRMIKQGGLPYRVLLCEFSNDALVSSQPDPLNDAPTKGITYSISQSGKIIRPIGMSKIWLRQKTLADQEQVIIQSETGRVDIQSAEIASSQCP